VASANAATSFVDGSVQSGQTYYYVVTAVDTTGTVSGYSNQVQAVIPSP
jgi:fibronectin type 3 domain-containing protein